ncbi:hypothetical protein EIP86_003964 [Pleurotus ostreatoroseus]|nr:hypothetical protein EIP86_003964 [Pleurotus ostreatoroseus]
MVGTAFTPSFMPSSTWDGKKALYYHRRIYHDQQRVEEQVVWLERPKAWRYEPKWAMEWDQQDVQKIAKHWVPMLFCSPGVFRGWYQIESNTKPRTPSSRHASDEPLTRIRFATAESIPEELFAYILSSYNKRALAKCSQVCRYWAEKCRPRLFQSLSLRKSPQRVFEFVQFQRDPDCKFLPYLKTLRNLPVNEVASKQRPGPWMHVLAQAWDGDAVSETVRIHGPVGESVVNIRSVHFSVARSPLPLHFSRNISKLLLNNIHFRRFEDSVRMACELPDLEWFLCEDQPTSEMLSGQQYVSTMLFLFQSAYSVASFFHDDDVARIRRLLHAFRNLPPNKMAKYDVYDLNRPSCHKALGTISVHHYRNGSECVSSALAEFGYPPFLVVHVQHRTDIEPLVEEQSSFADDNILSLMIRPDAKWENGERLEVDWTQLNNTVFSTMPRHSRLKIVFAFEDRSRMIHFSKQTVETQMPSLSKRGSVQYAIGVKEQRKGDLPSK